MEDEKAAKPVGPEPILTCVQCLAEYKESENGGKFNMNLPWSFSLCFSMPAHRGLLQIPQWYHQLLQEQPELLQQESQQW